MNILVIGSGGREHALCYALKKSPQCKALYCIPGNAGIAEVAKCENIRITDFDSIVEFCRENLVNFVIVGPEAPLVEGITDFLEDRGIKVFGPSKAAARLEASKIFTKQICEKANIPTAKSRSFTNAAEAKEYIKELGAPIVIKADGLAAGKGVVVAENLEQALEAVDDILVEKNFGDAGNEILVEEFMQGRELSFFIATNGDKVFEFGTACDYKRAYDGNLGLNTGGMGTFSPADMVDEALRIEIMDKIINPTLKTMKEMGCPYKGFLFAGLMLTDEGAKLIEYNCRMGDPETQSILPRLENDIVEILLGHQKPQLSKETALCVVMAAEGYPKSYVKNTEIKGLEAVEDAIIFHAGTAKREGKLVNTGGRVLGIVAVAETLATAKEKAYAAVSKINWPQGFYRKDIGEIYD
ncbi:MAG: phosphoribosylamine--glycine ligase [Alphaproteobacteria bacterium CG11_big_fil_rev_8_21_14_0_20_44_7]|nr:MAG: phosphoribosylamine--glycine ligase [Alphaproteobacteria bacterium CG11_big_fil_rev_8_21_14_0_20_44_7]